MSDLAKKFEEIYFEQFQKPAPAYIMCMLSKEIRWKPRDINGIGLYLAGNNKLLTSERVTDTDVLILFKTVRFSSVFAVINLSYNNLGDKAARAIAEYLQENTTLLKLNLMCNEIEEEGGELLAWAFAKNNTLTSLIMNGNKIGKKGSLAFAQVLQVNKGLKELDLGHTDQTIDSMVAFAVVLRFSNSTLLKLNISRPLLKGQAHECFTVHIGEMLKDNKSLKELRLSKIDIRDFGATRISDALEFNSTLTHLYLSSNRIGEDGAKVLCDAILEKNHMQYLDIGYNRLKDPGVKFFADMLAVNTSLKTLVLVFNCFGSSGLQSIIATLKHYNKTLTGIYIWGNQFDPKSCKAFDDLLKTDRLHRDHVDVRPYDVDGYYYFSELNNHPDRNFYWAPSYGDNVPYSQIYGNGYEKRPTFNVDVKLLE